MSPKAKVMTFEEQKVQESVKDKIRLNFGILRKVFFFCLGIISYFAFLA